MAWLGGGKRLGPVTQTKQSFIKERTIMKNKIDNVAKSVMLLGLRLSLPRWTAVLALLIASLAAPVMAQETGTVTVTGTFTSDSGEHAWSLTLYGTTHSHSQGLVW